MIKTGFVRSFFKENFTGTFSVKGEVLHLVACHIQPRLIASPGRCGRYGNVSPWRERYWRRRSGYTLRFSVTAL